jgi:glyoxylase I family protein
LSDCRFREERTILYRDHRDEGKQLAADQATTLTATFSYLPCLEATPMAYESRQLYMCHSIVFLVLVRKLSDKGGFMNQPEQGSTAVSQTQRSSEGESFIKAFRGVRYQVKDVSRSIDFYTRRLGFKLEQKHLPAFGEVSVGDLKLILSGPGASGSRPMPDGHNQEPGGWNRIVLQVTDLQNRIEALKTAGIRFRNEMEVGPGGKQIQLEDPDGNPLELFEPA